MSKIRYRLVWNYANKLNMQGQAPVSLECRQGVQLICNGFIILVIPLSNGAIDKNLSLRNKLQRILYEE